jgi:hypothetical protein
MLRLLFVVEVHSLRFNEFVDFAAYEAGEEFFGEFVRDGLACVCKWEVMKIGCEGDS